MGRHLRRACGPLGGLLPALLLALVAVSPGCGNAVSSGRSTSLSGFDLKAMTDRMAQSLLSDPNVQQAISEGEPMRVVVLPVENRLTGEVLPLGQARAFTAELRHLLGRQRADAFTWINNRDTFYALRDRELEGIDLGPSPDATDPQYALHATFTSLLKTDKRGQSAFYVCNFELTDMQNRNVLWSDVYNVRKAAGRNFLD